MYINAPILEYVIEICVLAAATSDFTIPADPTVTFTVGQGDGDSQCLSVTILNDNDFEGDHDFTVQIMSIEPSSVDIVTTAMGSVVIEDDDGEILTVTAFFFLMIVLWSGSRVPGPPKVEGLGRIVWECTVIHFREV